MASAQVPSALPAQPLQQLHIVLRGRNPQEGALWVPCQRQCCACGMVHLVGMARMEAYIGGIGSAASQSGDDIRDTWRGKGRPTDGSIRERHHGSVWLPWKRSRPCEERMWG